MKTEAVRLIVFLLSFGIISYIVGYIVAGLRTLGQIRRCFPDLYDELKRRCNG